MGNFVTYVDPCRENGVFVFARIAEELGRLRPEIPLLVVEGSGTEATLAACGLELAQAGNVFIMENCSSPDEYSNITSLFLFPSLVDLGRVKIGSVVADSAAPIIASEIACGSGLGDRAGRLLPLPAGADRNAVDVPEADGVRRWVEEIINAWDGADRPEATGRAEPVTGRSKLAATDDPPVSELKTAAVLVPHLNGVDWECELALRELERLGVKVVRSGGSSQIDVARNRLASEALHDGAGSIFFIDSDIGFDPLDAVRLINRPEPVVSGVYVKKGRRQFASEFAEGIGEVRFGDLASGLHPLKYAATGFLRVKSFVLWEMIKSLNLPICDRPWGRGLWPFFQPLVVTRDDGQHHYLGEDWAFSHRLSQMGIVPMADTSIRLWHYGRYPFGWEDAGSGTARYRRYHFKIGR